MRPFKNKLKEQNHTHSSLKYEERTKNRNNKTRQHQTKQKPCHKTNGLAAAGRAAPRPAGASYLMGGRGSEPSGPLASVWNLPSLFTPLPSLSNFPSQCFCSNVSGALFHRKISVWERLFFAELGVFFFFFFTSLLFPAYYLFLLLSWHFC